MKRPFALRVLSRAGRIVRYVGYGLSPHLMAKASAVEKAAWEERESLLFLQGFHLMLAPPKTGTTTVIKTLEQMELPGILERAHRLNDPLRTFDLAWGDPNSPDFPAAPIINFARRSWEISSKLAFFRKIQLEFANTTLSAAEPRPQIIVTLREPVSRYLSEIYYEDFHINRRVTLTEDDAYAKMLDKVHLFGRTYWWELDKWLDFEIRDLFNLDLFQVPFNWNQGWQIYESPDVRLLLIRQENMKELRTALGEFYDREAASIHVPSDNVGEDNAYGDAYLKAKKSIRLPAELLEEVYSSRFATHFYSQDERTKFSQRWRA